eukprot:NODE_853_length_3537_cov_0.511053.p2 type:complete len:228 gc:universal NODE_853_length_3537_cov_0.511053:2098-1415(-)
MLENALVFDKGLWYDSQMLNVEYPSIHLMGLKKRSLPTNSKPTHLNRKRIVAALTTLVILAVSSFGIYDTKRKINVAQSHIEINEKWKNDANNELHATCAFKPVCQKGVNPVGDYCKHAGKSEHCYHNVTLFNLDLGICSTVDSEITTQCNNVLENGQCILEAFGESPEYRTAYYKETIVPLTQTLDRLKQHKDNLGTRSTFSIVGAGISGVILICLFSFWSFNKIT